MTRKMSRWVLKPTLKLQPDNITDKTLSAIDEKSLIKKMLGYTKNSHKFMVAGFLLLYCRFIATLFFAPLGVNSWRKVD